MTPTRGGNGQPKENGAEINRQSSLLEDSQSSLIKFSKSLQNDGKEHGEEDHKAAEES